MPRLDQQRKVIGAVVYDADVIIKDDGHGKYFYDVSNLTKNETLTQQLDVQAKALTGAESTALLAGGAGSASGVSTTDNIPKPSDEIKADPEGFARRSLVARVENGAKEEKESALVVATTPQNQPYDNMCGDIYIRKDATLETTTHDPRIYSSTTHTYIYGTLTLNEDNWTVGGGCIIHLYDGALINGTRSNALHFNTGKLQQHPRINLMTTNATSADSFSSFAPFSTRATSDRRANASGSRLISSAGFGIV